VTIIGLVVIAVAAVMLVKSGSRQSSVMSTDPVATETTKTEAGARLPRLLDLGSNKCIPCRMMAPILADLKRTHAGAFAVEVIDVREDQEAARKHAIRVIPTQIFYDASGKERFRHEGFMSRDAILAKWRELGVKVVGSSPGARSEGT